MSDTTSASSVHDQPPTNWFVLGMDGWLVGLASIMVAVLLAYLSYRVVGSRVKQKNIKAKGSVAGGSIGGNPAPIGKVSQVDIEADGDVAGGNISRPAK